MGTRAPQPGERAAGPYPRLPEDAQRAEAVRRREGRLAGLLFIACPLASAPSSFLIEPAPPLSLYLVGAASILVGLVCMLLPWERMSRLWLHLLGAFATVEVTLAIAVSDDFYVFFYFFIAVFAAYVAQNRTELVVQLGLISLGLLSPVVYDPGATHEDTARLALLAIPALAITAGLVFYLRERLEAERLAYRRFAEEALELTSRIRGVELEPQPVVTTEAPAPSKPSIPEHWRAPALAAVAVVLGIPLLSAGLAAAGVTLPGAVREPFEQIGIELPNQADESPVTTEPVTPEPAPSGPAEAGGEGGGHERGDGQRSNREASAGGDARASSGEPGSQGGADPAGEVTTQSVEPAPDPSTEPAPTNPTDPEPAPPDSLGDRLRDTLEGVDQLLNGLRLNQ